MAPDSITIATAWLYFILWRLPKVEAASREIHQIRDAYIGRIVRQGTNIVHMPEPRTNQRGDDDVRRKRQAEECGSPFSNVTREHVVSWVHLAKVIDRKVRAN